MEVIKFLQSFSNPVLDKIFSGITMTGEEFIPIMVLAIIFWCRDKKRGYKLGLALTFSIVFNGAIKDIVKSPRPIGEEGIKSLRTKTATGYSFPSGHTQNITVLFSWLMIEFKNKWLNVLGVLLIILVATSRMYLGVHWPKDVIGGIAFGIISVLVGNYIFDIEDIRKRNVVFIFLMVLSLVGTVFFKSTDYYKATGVFLGFFTGYFVESSYIKFSVKADTTKNIAKILLGLVGVIAIRIFMKRILPADNYGDILRYFAMGFWCTAGAPYLFLKFNLAEKEFKTMKNVN